MPVQVTYKTSVCLTEVCGKRQASKGACSIKINCSHRRRVHMSVSFIVVKVRVSTRPSLCKRHMHPPESRSLHYSSVSLHVWSFSIMEWNLKDEAIMNHHLLVSRSRSQYHYISLHSNWQTLGNTFSILYEIYCYTRYRVCLFLWFLILSVLYTQNCLIKSYF